MQSNFDLVKVFQGCPIIYIALLFLSIAACVIWLYSMLTLRISVMLPKNLINGTRELLAKHRYDSILMKCQQNPSFSSSIIAAGISVRKHGPQVMMEIMRSEARRCGNLFWQRISFLNEIAIVAPMLGLLGTVLGLFFAFYDMNSSAESIATLFDGLGIAVGTTLAGLIVAILAMIFYATLKYRLVRLLITIEHETLALVSVLRPEYPSENSNYIEKP
jgi:biopolymer transport protein ExbB